MLMVDAHSVSLAQLQSSDIRIEWFEAVAITQALCNVILNTGDRGGPAKLAAVDIRIDSSGRLRAHVNEPGTQETAVRNITEMMRAILPDEGVPAALRSALTEATGC